MTIYTPIDKTPRYALGIGVSLNTGILPSALRDKCIYPSQYALLSEWEIH
jgi:hypothetical protein